MTNTAANQIVSRENEAEQIERLAAQRQLYSKAKNWFKFQFSLTVLIPTVLSGIAGLFPDTKVYLVLLSMVVAFLDSYLLENLIKNLKLKATQIQEKFDCYVLELPVSKVRSTSDVFPEDIIDNANLQINKYGIKSLEDWYSKEVALLPLHLARVVCQRTNCWWDGDVRKKFAAFLWLTMFLIVLVLLVIAILTNSDVLTFLLNLGIFSATIQFCIKHGVLQREAYTRLERMLKDATKLFDDILENRISETDALEKSRLLQDEIYEHRSKSPLILDVIYKFKRDRNEKLMNISAKKLVEKGLVKLK